MIQRSWLIIGIGGLGVFLLVFFVFISRPASNQETATQPAADFRITSQKSTQEAVSQPPSTALSYTGASWTLGIPKEPEFKPFIEQEGNKVKDTFLERFYALANPFGSITSEPASSATAKAGVSEQPSQESFQPAKPKRVLTDEEWFKIAYPDFYLGSLRQIGNFMKRRGFLAASESLDFKTESEVHAFLHKIVDFALNEGIITSVEAEGARNGIDVILPGLQQQERYRANQQLISLFLKIFGTETAWAFLGDCYREGVSMSSGFNGFAICCNCGLQDYVYYYVYIYDCSQSYCDIDLGCKNLICTGYKPVIWDPGSFTCGCG